MPPRGEHRPKICAACDKRIYERRYARGIARRLTDGDGTGEPPTHAYPCPESNGWHVGHIPSGDRRREGKNLRARRPSRARGHRRRPGPVARRPTALAPGEDLAALARRMRGLPPPGDPR